MSNHESGRRSLFLKYALRFRTEINAKKANVFFISKHLFLTDGRALRTNQHYSGIVKSVFREN